MENWTLTWTKLTELSGSSVKKLADNLQGVYRFSYKAENGNYYVFYVGKAEDIKKRLLEHLSSSEQNVGIKDYLATKECFFRYANITKDYIRNATERQMYRQYEPSCNGKEPEGRDDVKVNLT
ncbi:MAG: GIY-YIG nuclease family protein [Planctomycetes bacterium]|nr:GIY-YIG nuclease family protein [Planctomycetota bacterium]MBU1517833.1 GIY-YIG nuclease family protein [Planctomycetota bacterium]MBU2458288.1 GIY-YIG nuclease family protein [Planctomycetota bacterium]MBU2596718.1 GIY-YIG nuclease family protein [Planctomycetota bacterium]